MIYLNDAPTQISSGANARGVRVVNPLGTSRFVVVWHDGAGNINGRRIDASVADPAWDSIVLLRNNALAANTCAMDIAVGANVSSSNDWVLAYQTNAAAPNKTIHIYRYDSTASLAQLATIATGEAQSVDFLAVTLLATSAGAGFGSSG